MKLVIARSVTTGNLDPRENPYLTQANVLYAERVIGNLENDSAFCTACAYECIYCRAPYRRSFGSDIARVIDFPSVLPYVLEHPAEYLPQSVPEHKVLLVIAVHEQILLEMLRVCAEWGTQGVVVPVEAPGWICGATKKRARELCEAHKIEIAFPKPFCSFNPPQGTVLDTFRQYFHIGYPEVGITVADRRVTGADVRVSAACGATYYIARWLKGKGLDDDLKIDVISKRMHSYPCTASMEWDDEIDDTPLHIAGQAHYAMLSQIVEDETAEAEMLRSPLGTMVQRPVPVHENLANIETAKNYILDTLKAKSVMPLIELRCVASISPAALNSALLILKKEGTIYVKNKQIHLAQ